MNRETEMNHCAKCAQHHDMMAKSCRKMAKSHSAIADNTSDQTTATFHRDVAKAHGMMAESHDEMREHFEDRREAVANGGNADQMENHSDAGDILMNSAAAHFLRSNGEFDLRKLISAEY